MAETNAVQQEADDEVDTGRSMDPELRVLSGILRDLRKLDDAARARVISYLASRFKETDR